MAYISAITQLLSFKSNFIFSSRIESSIFSAEEGCEILGGYNPGILHGQTVVPIALIWENQIII